MALNPDVVCTRVSCECEKIHVNKPRFNISCKGGANCPNANCYYTHPEERKQPKLIYVFCKRGVRCSRASCAFIHPERRGENYIERPVKKCKLRANCPDKDGKCNLPGHNEPPPLCRFGSNCHRKDLSKFACPYSHTKIQAPCPKGADCVRGNKCWYALHPVVYEHPQVHFVNTPFPGRR